MGHTALIFVKIFKCDLIGSCISDLKQFFVVFFLNWLLCETNLFVMCVKFAVEVFN